MEEELTYAVEAIRRCIELRDARNVEAVLRAEFQSHLRRIFSSKKDESWLNHYSSGSEAKTRVSIAGNSKANRFIDNLIGCTTIEYEADLRITAKFDEGYRQVREHVAGLVGGGIPIVQVRGILSDTVDWYVYDATLAEGAEPSSCTPEMIELNLVDELRLEKEDEASAIRLIQFIRKHLAREQSRPLHASYLVSDLGLESTPYSRTSAPLSDIVSAGRDSDTSIALATDLWSVFVDYLEGEVGYFRVEAYVDELYLSILSRLLSANVLSGKAISSEDEELKSILNGSYFQNLYQLSNMVELDYFGWITKVGQIENLVPLARDIQHDLYAYDFSYYPEEDLFGRLMAQLARRSQRKLLGQEWTPSWLSNLLVERCLDNLPENEKPRIVDMCCGSGSILAEIIKSTKQRFSLNDINELHDVATGFDIDPLAVSLAKTTWVVALAEEIKSATDPVTIPVYHADSLFAVTPISSSIPLPDEEKDIEITLDGSTIEIPVALVQPSYRELFDCIVDWAYDEALEAQANAGSNQITEPITENFLKSTIAATGVEVSDELFHSLKQSILSLASRMSELAIANRNGIWAFILRNTYRPGLLSGQFNGLVSNPPWLAMSGIAENPYKEALTTRAKAYDIRPSAQSFLHLELGTMHLLHAVDRYLSNNASIACLVPGTIFNGHHHQAFRSKQFLTAPRQVNLFINEVWQVERNTFKYPGAAIIGTKSLGVIDEGVFEMSGFLASQMGLEEVDLAVVSLSEDRTAWVLEKEGAPIIPNAEAVIPQQGADIMPRTCVCVDILESDGKEYRVNTPDKNSDWAFTVKSAKELKGQVFPGHVAPQFIYEMVQSENLLPFTLGRFCAPISIPAERDNSGKWKIYSDADIRRMGCRETARRFQRINARLSEVGKGKSIQDRVDERGKLTKQNFGETGYLVFTGAGGKYICSACMSVEQAERIVIDQTVYWHKVDSADEAYYRVGILNSQALTEAITPFNPKGAFGERHIHTLPYRLLPPFDPENLDHIAIAEIARSVEFKARELACEDIYICNPNKALHVRRSRMRAALSEMDEWQKLEILTSAALGVTVATKEIEQ